MNSRWRRACIAVGVTLALGLTATPAQAAPADPVAAPDTALPDPALADLALPDPGLADQVGTDPTPGLDQLRLTLTVQTATGTFGTAATGISFEPTPTGCRLTVPGVITFPGPNDPDPDPAIVGSAAAVTTAWVSAPCADARSVPPGTYPDTFTSTGTFTGTIQGVPVTAPISYRGVTARGGDIDAALFISGLRAGASLLADARVLQGGTYSGIVWS